MLAWIEEEDAVGYGWVDGNDINTEMWEKLVTYLSHGSSFALRRLPVL